MSRTIRTWSVRWVPEVFAVPAGAGMGWQVYQHGCPWLLSASVTALSVLAYSTFFTHLANSWQTTTHRCPDCDFTVRLTDVDPGESRRWQEAAAAHPHHDLP